MHRFIRSRVGAFVEAVCLALVLAIVGGTVTVTLPDVLDLDGVQAGTSTITGAAFTDTDVDGTRDAGEPGLAGNKVLLMDVSGAALRTVLTDAAGGFIFADLSPGHYTVRYSSQDWWGLRESWTPTTTGSIRPEADIDLVSTAVVDFGWRPIVKSLDLTAPISRFVGSNGLTVESFNDVVAAEDVYNTVMLGTVGAEAPGVTVRLGFSTSSSTTTSVTRPDGSYSAFSATSWVSFGSWLDGDWTLSHEYGHAWSLYHAYIVQQDPTLSGYLAARQLTGDTRVGTSYAWQPRELIADDYRQLFGSTTAQAVAPLNLAIPLPADVPGLREYLAGAFVGASPAMASTTAAADPTTTPTPSPTPQPAATTEPTPSPVPSTVATPAPTAADLAVTGLTVSPNPIKSQAAIGFDITGPASISVAIVDSRGRVIRSLLTESPVAAGHVSANWDRRDAAGRRVKAGNYVVRVVAVSATDADQQQKPINVS